MKLCDNPVLSQMLTVASTFLRHLFAHWLWTLINTYIHSLKKKKHPFTPSCLLLLSLYRASKLGNLFHAKSIKSLVREKKAWQRRQVLQHSQNTVRDSHWTLPVIHFTVQGGAWAPLSSFWQVQFQALKPQIKMNGKILRSNKLFSWTVGHLGLVRLRMIILKLIKI